MPFDEASTTAFSLSRSVWGTLFLQYGARQYAQFQSTEENPRQISTKAISVFASHVTNLKKLQTMYCLEEASAVQISFVYETEPISCIDFLRSNPKFLIFEERFLNSAFVAITLSFAVLC